MRSPTTVIAAACLLAATAVARADESPDDDIPDETAATEEGREAGWHPLLKAATSASLSDNRNVVGNDDGTNFTGSILVQGRLGYLSENRRYEWISNLSWNLGYTKSPTVEPFLKSIDALDLDTNLLVHVPGTDWFGPFGRVGLHAAAFKGYTVSATDVTVRRLDHAGEELGTEEVPAGEVIDMTVGFAPTTMRQGLGAFAVPVDREDLRFETRLGVAAWETWVRDGFYVDDDEDTEALELRQMQNSTQLGAELNLDVRGAIAPSITWGVHAGFMQPFVHSADTELTGTELLNTDVQGALGVKLTEWASLDYTLKLVRQPLVMDGWQRQMGLLLSLNANII